MHAWTSQKENVFFLLKNTKKHRRHIISFTYSSQYLNMDPANYSYTTTCLDMKNYINLIDERVFNNSLATKIRSTVLFYLKPEQLQSLFLHLLIFLQSLDVWHSHFSFKRKENLRMQKYISWKVVQHLISSLGLVSSFTNHDRSNNCKYDENTQK